MTGLVLAIINFEYDVKYVPIPVDVATFNNPLEHPRNTSLFNCTCRIITVLSTIFSIVCLYMRHRYKLKWVNTYFSAENRDPNHINFMYDEIINE